MGVASKTPEGLTRDEVKAMEEKISAAADQARKLYSWATGERMLIFGWRMTWTKLSGR